MSDTERPILDFLGGIEGWAWFDGNVLCGWRPGSQPGRLTMLHAGQDSRNILRRLERRGLVDRRRTDDGPRYSLATTGAAT